MIEKKQKKDPNWGKDGTASYEDFSDISKKALADVVKKTPKRPPDIACAEKANDAVDDQMFGMNKETVRIDMKKVPKDLDKKMNLVPL